MPHHPILDLMINSHVSFHSHLLSIHRKDFFSYFIRIFQTTVFEQYIYKNYTVEPALRDPSGEAVKVVSRDRIRWSLKPSFQKFEKIRENIRS